MLRYQSLVVSVRVHGVVLFVFYLHDYLRPLTTDLNSLHVSALALNNQNLAATAGGGFGLMGHKASARYSVNAFCERSVDGFPCLGIESL